MDQSKFEKDKSVTLKEDNLYSLPIIEPQKNWCKKVLTVHNVSKRLLIDSI